VKNRGLDWEALYPHSWEDGLLTDGEKEQVLAGPKVMDQKNDFLESLPVQCCLGTSAALTTHLTDQHCPCSYANQVNIFIT
jgi:hypothetical protein